METELNVRKLILADGDWKVYVHYSGNTIKDIELERYENNVLITTYYPGDVWGLDSVMEAIPKTIWDATEALFK